MFIDVLEMILSSKSRRVKMIDELTELTAKTIKEVCKIADKYGVDRKETVEHFVRVSSAVVNFPYLKELEVDEQEEK